MVDTPPADPREPNDQHEPPRRRAVIVLAVVFAAILVSQTLLRRDPPDADRAPRATDDAAGTVTLVVETGDAESGDAEPTEAVPGDEERRDQTIAWSDGMTVLDALLAGAEVDQTGRGREAFVNAVNGVANEGPGGRNWQYFVNGQRGVVGAGARPIDAGDRVLWKFTNYE